MESKELKKLGFTEVPRFFKFSDKMNFKTLFTLFFLFGLIVLIIRLPELDGGFWLGLALFIFGLGGLTVMYLYNNKKFNEMYQRIMHYKSTMLLVSSSGILERIDFRNERITPEEIRKRSIRFIRKAIGGKTEKEIYQKFLFETHERIVRLKKQHRVLESLGWEKVAACYKKDLAVLESM